MSPFGSGRGGWPRSKRGACDQCGDWTKLHEHGVLRLCRACLDRALESIHSTEVK